MMNMNTNANTDKIIDFLNDLTNKVGEGKHITLLAEKQDWFDAKRTLAQERLYGWDEGDVIVDNDGNIFTFDDDNSWHVEHLSEEEWRKAEVEDQIEQMTDRIGWDFQDRMGYEKVSYGDMEDFLNEVFAEMRIAADGDAEVAEKFEKKVLKSLGILPSVLHINDNGSTITISGGFVRWKEMVFEIKKQATVRF
jgi:hypothetical protein